ncbi:MAG: MBL fold metallo-hydrolase [Solirubrobacteraceae bacterium]
MRVTVLGKSPSWPDAGGACSGYLVEQDGFTLLLDCGSGVFAKLRRVRDYADVDAVLVSHMHSDHFIDLVPFSNALLYGPRRLRRPRLCLPPGGLATLEQASAPGGRSGLVDSAFVATEYEPAQRCTLGPLEASFCPVPHFIPANAVSLSAGGEGAPRFTFSADCAPNDELVRFAAGSELLLIEATLQEPDEYGGRGHLTARDAGDHGRRAGARQLVLTHWSDELDAGRLRADAEAAFGGSVALAAEDQTYMV